MFCFIAASVRVGRIRLPDALAQIFHTLMLLFGQPPQVQHGEAEAFVLAGQRRRRSRLASGKVSSQLQKNPQNRFIQMHEWMNRRSGTTQRVPEQTDKQCRCGPAPDLLCLWSDCGGRLLWDLDQTSFQRKTCKPKPLY